MGQVGGLETDPPLIAEGSVLIVAYLLDEGALEVFYLQPFPMQKAGQEDDNESSNHGDPFVNLDVLQLYN
jgi:hypothetical protein